MMDRRTFLSTLASGLLAAPLAVEAQPVGKPVRYDGYLWISTSTPIEPGG